MPLILHNDHNPNCKYILIKSNNLTTQNAHGQPGDGVYRFNTNTMWRAVLPDAGLRGIGDGCTVSPGGVFRPVVATVSFFYLCPGVFFDHKTIRVYVNLFTKHFHINASNKNKYLYINPEKQRFLKEKYPSFCILKDGFRTDNSNMNILNVLYI